MEDEDPSHYLGILPAIDLVKFTNGEDANLPTGPFIAEGGGVTWTYEVTNTGSAPLTDLVVTDPRLGAGADVVTCQATELDPGESTLCTANGSAELGQYANIASAIAVDPFGDQVGSLDPSHYFGAESGISLFKYTNGIDANEPPGPNIPEGDEVLWTYDVVEHGQTPLTEIELVDDQLGPITCPQDTLAVGAEMQCTATGTAERGQYANNATVTGIDAAENTVTDEDPSHYFGFVVEVDIEKFTNGEDADEPTGPEIPVGDPVTWTYEVTNPGDFALADIVVTDDQGVTPVFQGGDTNGDDLLDPSETWLYEATGTAELGQYANVGTVEGTNPVEVESTLTDSDPSHYIGIDVGTATLGDTVWLDENANGVQDGGEVGLQGARVTVADASASTAASPATLQATEVPVTVTTGSEGDYLVTELLAGDYTVTIDLNSVDPSLSLTTPGSVTVTLDVGETFLDADFGLVQPDEPQVNPGIDVVKTATPFQVLPGGTATYTYAVSNTGNVPLAGVRGSITDDKCSPVSYVSGDLNDNGLLDAAENGSAAETWIFTCSTILTEDTTNVVTVDGTPVLPDGTPIGDPVSASDEATVEVIDELPATGVAPIWMALAALLAAAGALILVANPRRLRSQ